MAGVALKSGSVLAPTISMSQSTVMVGALFAGFLVWLAMNGKLQAYWALLLGGGSSTASTASTPATTSSSGGSTSTSGGSTSTSSGAPGSQSGGSGGATPGSSPGASVLSFGGPPSLAQGFGLGGTGGPAIVANPTVGFNAMSLNAFSGLTPGSVNLFGIDAGAQ
jgi:hypothetical protein